MTFYCHHCDREAYATPHPQRLFHPIRGWIHACHNCQKEHDDATQ